MMKLQELLMNNIYKEKNPASFNELAYLINVYPKHYSRMLQTDKYKHLLNWLNASLPLLNDTIYSIPTKCYWILNGIIDFPQCATCHKKYIGKNINNISKGYNKTCSQLCGVHNDEAIRKKKETNIKKYGVEFAIAAKQTREKAEATQLKRYGAKNPFDKKSKCYSHKYDQATIQYGKTIINSSQIPGVVEQVKQTKLERYGKNCFDIEKLKATNREKYGVDFVFSANTVKAKIKKTMLETYGVDNPWKSHDIQKRIKKRYTYNKISFDSMPEIACYIYLTDHNIEFTYQPKCPIKYIFNGKIYTAWPDFLVNGKLWEIKGKQFIDKKTGKWKCPFDRQLDDVYEAKHKALLQANVKLIYEDKYKQYIEYIDNKYGRGYLRQFKNY